MHLLSLPEEILSITIGYIDEPQDLVSLALTSKCLCNIIIPNHLHMRRIRSTVDLPAYLFQKLAQQPGLAANVRHLELHWKSGILGEEEHVPRFLLDFSDKPPTHYLPLAMRYMTTLTRFYYRGPHNSSAIQAIFSYLQRNCEILEEFGFEFSHSESLEQENIEIELPVTAIQRLNVLSLTMGNECPCFTKSSHPFYKSLITNSNIILQDFHLRISNDLAPSFSADFFKSIHWPRLERLSINANAAWMQSHSFDGPLREFLRRHPTLKALCVTPHFPLPTNTIFLEEPDFLPNLRALKLCIASYYTPSLRKASIARQLTYYGCPIDGGTALKELKYMPGLKGCRLILLRHHKLMLWKLTKKIPMLERLDCLIRGRRYYHWPSMWDVKSFLWILGRFTKLTHLAGLLAMREMDIDRFPENETFIERATTSIRSLQFLEIMKGRQRQWIKIKRTQTGLYDGYEVLGRDKLLEEPDWGMFCNGFRMSTDRDFT
ncbi:hypothetical protein M422DRAFT_246311 [Sphaerobolus stellatus SS14]|nr:hypothetical protein M422DRAFT_246311 [Sphaerobolus stellatus SS14]